MASDLQAGDWEGSAGWRYIISFLSGFFGRCHLFRWERGAAPPLPLAHLQVVETWDTTVSTPPCFLAFMNFASYQYCSNILSSRLYQHFFKTLTVFFLPPCQKRVLSTMEAAIAPVRILQQVFIAVVLLDSPSSWMGRLVKVACASPCC